GFDQNQGRRRVLNDRVKQEFALEQMLALFAQDAPKFVVRTDEIADFVATLCADREAEIPVAERSNAARQRADQSRDWTRQRARENQRRNREREHGGSRTKPRR